MDKKSRKKKHRKPLRDKIDSEDIGIDSILYEIELDLYLECIRLDRKRKQKYIV